MLRLGYVSTYPPTHCGIAEYTRFLTTSLKSIYPEAKIVIFSDSGSSYRVESNAEIRPSFEKGVRDYRGILNELSEVGGVDVIHVQHEYGIFGRNNAILETCLEAKDEKLVKKVVFTMHSVYHPLSGDLDALNFQKRLSSVDAVIVHSYLMEFEIQHQGVDPLIIRRIPHGTLLNPYLGHPRYKLLKDLELEDSMLKGLTLSLFGFLRRDKGLDMLLEALMETNYGKDSMNVIIGGELKDRELLEQIEDLSRRVKLTFIERYLMSDEILKIASIADIILLPYRDKYGVYSVSGILHLSMGSFKPLIGSRVPRLIELYQFAPRATVPPKKPAELAKKLKWMIENYDYAVAYMAHLYSYAVRTQWLRMARRHLNLYHELLRSKS